jgi:hypothetical protein
MTASVFNNIFLSPLFANMMRVLAVVKRVYNTGTNVSITAGKIFLILPYENVHVTFTNYFPILGVLGIGIIQEAVNGLLVFLLRVIHWSEKNSCKV